MARGCQVCATKVPSCKSHITKRAEGLERERRGVERRASPGATGVSPVQPGGDARPSTGNSPRSACNHHAATVLHGYSESTILPGAFPVEKGEPVIAVGVPVDGL
jgi:hypothetical protein